MTTTHSFHSLSRASLALTAAALMAACGGGSRATTPNPPPVATPTPSPEPEPTPTTSCRPLPSPVTRFKVKIQFKNRDYWTLDATPLVGPDPEYCAAIGFTDGRQICTVRPEGDPMRAECEAYAVGNARDTGRPGPTWTRDGELCTGPESLCENDPDNQYQLRVYKGAVYTACAENGACGSVDADKDL